MDEWKRSRTPNTALAREAVAVGEEAAVEAASVMVPQTSSLDPTASPLRISEEPVLPQLYNAIYLLQLTTRLGVSVNGSKPTLEEISPGKVVDYWPLEVANQRQILGALPAFCFPSPSFLISQISLEAGYSLCSHHFVLTSALGERSYFYVAVLTTADQGGSKPNPQYKHLAICFQSTNRSIMAHLKLAEAFLLSWWEGMAVFASGGPLATLTKVHLPVATTSFLNFLSPHQLFESLQPYRDVLAPRPYRYLGVRPPSPPNQPHLSTQLLISLEWSVDAWEDLTEAPPAIGRLLSPPTDLPVSRLLFQLPIDAIIQVLEAILSEGRVVIFSHHPALLTQFVESFLQLINPLQWLHTMIPCLGMDSIDILDAPTPYLIGMVSNSLFPRYADADSGAPISRADLPESFIHDLAESGCFVIDLDHHRVVPPLPQPQDRSDRPLALPNDLRDEFGCALQHLYNRAMHLLATDPFGFGASSQKLSDTLSRYSSVIICKLLLRQLEAQAESITILKSTQAFSHFRLRTEPEIAEMRKTLQSISTLNLASYHTPTAFKSILDPFSAPQPKSGSPSTSAASHAPSATRRARQNNRVVGNSEWSLSGILTSGSATFTAQLASLSDSFCNLLPNLTDTADENARLITETLLSYCVDENASVTVAHLTAFLQILLAKSEILLVEEVSEPPIIFSDLYHALGGLAEHAKIKDAVTKNVAKDEETESCENISAALHKSKYWSRIVSLVGKWADLCQVSFATPEEPVAPILESPQEVHTKPTASNAPSVRAGPPTTSALRKAFSSFPSSNAVSIEQWERWLLDADFGLEYEEATAIVSSLRNAQMRRSGVSIGSLVRRTSTSASDKSTSGGSSSMVSDGVMKNLLLTLSQQRELIEKLETSVPSATASRATLEGFSNDSIGSNSGSNSANSSEQLNLAKEMWIAGTLSPNSVFRLSKKQKNCFLLLSTTRIVILQQSSSSSSSTVSVAFQVALKFVSGVEKFSSEKSKSGGGGYDRKALTLTWNETGDQQETLIFPTQSQRDVWYQILVELIWSFRISRDLSDHPRFILRSARRISFVAALHSIGSWSTLPSTPPMRSGARPGSAPSSLLAWHAAPPKRTAEIKSALAGFLNVSGLDSTIPSFKASESPNRLVLDLLATALSLFLSVHTMGSSAIELDSSSQRVVEFEAFEKSTSRLQQLDLAPLVASKNERTAFWTNLWNLMFLHGVMRCRILPANALEFRYLTTFTSYVCGRLPLSLDTVLQLLRGSAPVNGAELSPKRLQESDYRTQWGISQQDIDPRVHFVLAWFCKSSPRINLVSASAEALENTLEQATKNYLEKSVRVNTETRTVTVPRLFHWFREDWRQTADIIKWISEKLPADSSVKSALDKSRAVSVHYSWDWDSAGD